MNRPPGDRETRGGISRAGFFGGEGREGERAHPAMARAVTAPRGSMGVSHESGGAAGAAEAEAGGDDSASSGIF
jgi:hypothetical protein